LLRGYEGLKRRVARSDAYREKRVRKAAQEIVRLCEAWGKKDTAEEWRAKRARSAAEPEHRP
jgi:hypothetical protein